MRLGVTVHPGCSFMRAAFETTLIGVFWKTLGDNEEERSIYNDKEGARCINKQS